MRKLLLASAATMGALLATTGGALAQPAKLVAPGTVAVHLNGYLQFSIADVGSSGNAVGVVKTEPGHHRCGGDASASMPVLTARP